MPSILIVDDDPTIRGMFARIVQQLGEVHQVANGGEALRTLSVKQFDVILLDLHMPAIDGLTVLQTLSSKKGLNSETPVVVITADMSEQAKAKAFHRGAVYVLSKPVPMGQLLAMVGSALKKSAAKRAPPTATPSGLPTKKS